MPIADLLGIQIDMHLLGRLTGSVAIVLLISWAYRFYSSRATAPKPQLYVRPPPDQPTRAHSETCQNVGKMELGPENIAKHDRGNIGNKLPVSNDLSPDSTNIGSDKGEMSQTEDIAELLHTQEMLREGTIVDEDNTLDLEAEIPVFVEEAEIITRNSVFGSTLKPDPSDLVSPQRSRSPCLLQRLQGSVGVGRELREDLEIQGAYSSFLSKAEITVEDANLIIEGPGAQSIVRGKIYEYYVESSSQSFTDSGDCHFDSKGHSLGSQHVEFGSHVGSLTEPSRSLSPVIMRDRVLPQSAVVCPSSPVSPEPTSPVKPGLRRKDSYLIAANSEIQIPSLTPSALNLLRSHIQASSSGESTTVSSLSPTTDSRGPIVWKKPSLETLAGARFVNLPLENMGCSELESLQAKLDLGNCLEVLELSKTHGHVPLQQAALRVMSDNYLQVLADPGMYGKLRASERDEIQRERGRGRRFLVAANLDPQDWMGCSSAQWTSTKQRATKKPSSGLYYYDDCKDSWHPLCAIPQEVISKGCAMCTMDNYLFVAVGGCQEGTNREIIPSKRVFCYNPLTSIWKEISPMNESRPHCKLAAMQGYIYAIGGECLSTVERYDPRTDRWTFVASLPNDTFAVAHHVTVCNGEAFVVGGTLRYTMLRYNPKTNVWRKSAITGSKERTTELVGVRNILYRFDINPQLGISVYRYHTVARLWFECCNKRITNCPAFQCVAVDDIIYCLSRQFTIRFQADEISPGFIDDDLSILPEAKSILFPFVLSLPDNKSTLVLQTSV